MFFLNGPRKIVSWVAVAAFFAAASPAFGAIVNRVHNASFEDSLGGSNNWDNTTTRGIDNPVNTSAPDGRRMLRLSEVTATSGLSFTFQTITGVQEGDVVAVSALARQTRDDADDQGEVRLEFPASTSLTLDTPVQVDLLLEEHPDVLVVPQQAVQKDPSASYVWIAGDDGRAHRRDVRVGLAVRGVTQILSGVTQGDRVILTGVSELSDGTPITWREGL